MRLATARPVLPGPHREHAVTDHQPAAKPIPWRSVIRQEHVRIGEGDLSVDSCSLWRPLLSRPRWCASHRNGTSVVAAVCPNAGKTHMEIWGRLQRCVCSSLPPAAASRRVGRRGVPGDHAARHEMKCVLR